MEKRTANGIGYITGVWPLDSMKSTLVFIHGAAGSSDFWSAQVQGLAGRINTVAIDLPGHGQSDGSGYDRVEDYARSVVNFINAIDIKKIIPCGISLGGAITQQLMLDYPDLFEAGILICTGSKLRVAPDIFNAIAEGMDYYAEMITKFVASKMTHPDRLRRFKSDTARCKSEVVVKDFRACDGFDVMGRIGSISAPVLVVTAEDDQVTPPKYGDFLENSISAASRTHVKDAGHIVPMEKPEEINQAIADFLDRTGL